MELNILGTTFRGKIGASERRVTRGKPSLYNGLILID